MCLCLQNWRPFSKFFYEDSKKDESIKKIHNLNELNRNYFSISKYRSTDFPDDLQERILHFLLHLKCENIEHRQMLWHKVQKFWASLSTNNYHQRVLTHIKEL